MEISTKDKVTVRSIKYSIFSLVFKTIDQHSLTYLLERPEENFLSF